jgi:outer membrane protein assembly factor BamB
MKNTNFNRTIVSSCVFMILASCAVAQDWPQWRGANRDGKAAGFTAPKAWPKELAKKWNIPVGKADATPALVGDKLYVFTRQDTDEVTLCLEAATGKEIWRDKYPAGAATGPASEHPGPRSSPTVAEGKVVTLGVRGALSCLDAGTGKVLWRKDDVSGWPQFFTAMSPVIVDGVCIAQLGGKDNGVIAAYDLATGSEKWKWTGEGPSYASPIIMEAGGMKLVIAQTDKSLMALNAADGKVAWQMPFAGKGMGGYNMATPIVDGQNLIFCGSGRGTTAVKFEKAGDTMTAKELWKNTDLSPQFNSPVLKNGLLFGLTQRGSFVCVNAQNGQTLWTDPTGNRGGFGSIVDAGPVLFALTPRSQLIVFEPSDKAYTEVASIKVANKQTYAYPVLAGNRLYVEDQDSLTLWTFE